MPFVLSTKMLTAAQKRHLFLANIGLVEYDAIKINPLDLRLKETVINNAIFTSQNAVKLVFSNNLEIKNAFCVGDKTRSLLEQNNIKIIANAENAKDLAGLIVEKYPHLYFNFFCSKQRRKELPEILGRHGVGFQEHHIYESICNYKTFKNQFDAILCFSPLGVKAYFEIHDKKPTAICIGETTAKVAEQYTNSVLRSTHTSVESVLIKAIKALS